MQGAFYGFGAAVIAIIAHSATRLIRKTVGPDRLLWTIVFANAVTTALLGRVVVWLIVASGLVVLLTRTVSGPAVAFAEHAFPHAVTGWSMDRVSVRRDRPV